MIKTASRLKQQFRTIGWKWDGAVDFLRHDPVPWMTQMADDLGIDHSDLNLKVETQPAFKIVSK